MQTQKVITQSIRTKVVSVTFENRQEIIQNLQLGEIVLMVREPMNPFDPNAIKVIRQDGCQIGYLDRQLAFRLSQRLDQYGLPMDACVSSIIGGYSAYASLGVIISFEMPE